MNDRRQHVIEKAHQLFIDRGFQATSIQDILDYSGISKGTFYNYFSSKNELLVAIFKALYHQMEQARNEILIGQDPTDIALFIKQIELQMESNKKNNLIDLYEEVIFSNDEDLKNFLKQGQLRMIHWVFERFTEIFGESKRPYLLDCSIMFLGILHHNMKYYTTAYGPTLSAHRVVRYSVERIVHIIEEVSNSGEQLIEPELLEALLPCGNKQKRLFIQELQKQIAHVKELFNSHSNRDKYMELLNFIQEEMIQSKQPRQFLIKSALESLMQDSTVNEKKEIMNLSELFTSHS
ncbi:TetR/AcrR family transcriptional regulator [Cytobacillus spongiae]|uniref:TetR/AcrR family transcriptional regulator n=1 Tax=Cytobacillus spongiae TaxID=2901381 RepID=UPI001F39C47C|nr:TetR/AcrR family transcriptional regulator [Cytobacillus spongiae]UII54204.1 TetR/AcrR family transcriptional regulator [Cytobacillus spongiae]